MKRSIPFLLVLATACGGAQQNTETLAESIRSYNEGIRWKRFEVAAVSIPPRERSHFVEAMDERSEDLRITDYEIVKVDRLKAKEAKVQVKVSWYKDTEGTLHETHAVQTWRQRGKAWLMVDEARMRGAEMPGLADKPEDPEPADPEPADPEIDDPGATPAAPPR